MITTYIETVAKGLILGVSSAGETPVISRDYAAVLAAALEKWFWGPLGPSKISPTVLFSKPISFSGGNIRRKLNFFQISGIPTPRRPDANRLVSL